MWQYRNFLFCSTSPRTVLSRAYGHVENNLWKNKGICIHNLSLVGLAAESVECTSFLFLVVRWKGQMEIVFWQCCCDNVYYYKTVFAMDYSWRCVWMLSKHNSETGWLPRKLTGAIIVDNNHRWFVDECWMNIGLFSVVFQNAVSMYCRLGFAIKKGQVISPDQLHPSWRSAPSVNRLKYEKAYLTLMNRLLVLAHVWKTNKTLAVLEILNSARWPGHTNKVLSVLLVIVTIFLLLDLS